MQSVRLSGRDHTKLTEVTVCAVDDGAAIGITRGHHPKAYPYTEPNEDAALLIIDEDVTVMAIADGHHGSAASHDAISAIEETASASGWDDPRAAATDLFDVGAAAVRQLAGHHPTDQAPPGTTLLVLVTIGKEGAVTWVGDSEAARIRKRRPRLLTPPEQVFINPTGKPHPHTTAFRLNPGDVVVAVTDGFTNFVAPRWPEPLAHLADGTSAESLVRKAFGLAADGGSGDNIAMTVAKVRR